MTKEEAISIMKVIVHMLEEKYDTDRVEEAVDMAIEALQQKPICPSAGVDCEDCPAYEDAISRQAVIDTIESWLSCDDYNEAERHIMRAMQSVLYDLPPVNPQKPYEPVRNPDQLDCVNRQAVLDTEYQTIDINGVEYVMLSEVQMKMRKLPSVSSSEKTGHWIPSHVPGSILDECSECGFSCGAFTFKFCPMCGAKMVEPQEGGDQE